MIVDKTFWGVSMGKLKRLLILLFLVTGLSQAFAKQLCFQIIQHDKAADNITEESLVVEDQVLNSFFDYGFIVTNSNAAISASQSQNEKLFNQGLSEAFNGFADYFVQINLYFEGGEKEISKSSDLEKVTFKLARTNTGKIIAEKSFNNAKHENKNDDLKKFSSSLAAEINKALQSE